MMNLGHFLASNGSAVKCTHLSVFPCLHFAMPPTSQPLIPCHHKGYINIASIAWAFKASEIGEMGGQNDSSG